MRISDAVRWPRNETTLLRKNVRGMSASWLLFPMHASGIHCCYDARFHSPKGRLSKTRLRHWFFGRSKNRNAERQRAEREQYQANGGWAKYARISVLGKNSTLTNLGKKRCLAVRRWEFLDAKTRLSIPIFLCVDLIHFDNIREQTPECRR